MILRPSEIVIGRLIFTAILSFFLFFIRQLPSDLTERNSTKTGHMFEIECNLKMHVPKLGYPVPLKIEAPKPPFSTTVQLSGNFNGL